MSGYGHILSVSVESSRDDAGCHHAGVTGTCELLDVGIGNQTQVPCKNSACSSTLNQSVDQNNHNLNKIFNHKITATNDEYQRLENTEIWWE